MLRNIFDLFSQRYNPAFSWLTATNGQTAIDQLANSLTLIYQYESAQQVITSAGQLVLPHGLPKEPALIQAHLVCLTTELGYAVDDKALLNLGLNSSSLNRGLSIVPDATNLTIRYGADTSALEILDKSLGTVGGITNANWELVVRAWSSF